MPHSSLVSEAQVEGPQVSTAQTNQEPEADWEPSHLPQAADLRRACAHLSRELSKRGYTIHLKKEQKVLGR